MNATRTAFLVDDDEAALDSMSRLLQTHGVAARCFCTAESYLQDVDPLAPGALVLDLYLPRMTGAELLESAAGSGRRL